MKRHEERFIDPDDAFELKVSQAAAEIREALQKEGKALPDASTLGADGLAMIYGYC